jgi:hypothetical protein
MESHQDDSSQHILQLYYQLTEQIATENNPLLSVQPSVQTS